MIWPAKLKIAFRVISALVAGIFLWNQIAWAGDLYNIPIDNIYVERTGNLKTGSTSERKEKTVMKYLKTGEYRRVRLIDDDMKNIKGFLSIEKKLPQKLINKIKKKHKIEGPETIPVIEFFGLFVKPNGNLQRIKL